MKRDCNTCIHKEGSCYPSTTIFDKDKTCKSYEPDYEGYIAELEKENAELRKEWQEQVQKATDEGYARTLQTIQFTKARELLKKLLSAYTTYADSFDDRDNEIVEEAEQFLKENSTYERIQKAKYNYTD